MLLSKESFQIFRISQSHQLIQSPFPQAEGGSGVGFFDSQSCPLFSKPSG